MILRIPDPLDDPLACKATRADLAGRTCTREATTLVVFDVEAGNPYHAHPGRKTSRLCALCVGEALDVVRDLFDPAAFLVPRSRWGEVLPGSG